jgi:hypothetical protein
MKTTTFALVAVTALSTASFASADAFSIIEDQEVNSVVELNTVNSTFGGSIEIRDFRLGTAGAVLGTVDLNAGANSHVRVNVGKEPLGDVVAVLLDAAGNTVATQKVDIIR